MKRRPYQTVYYWVGHRCHWRIISRYDQSEIASGSALTFSDARTQAKHKRIELHHDNHCRN